MARTLRTDSATLHPRRWMRALLLAVAVAGLGAATTVPEVARAQAAADRSMSVPISPDAPERYVVKKGDTLWDISAMYLKDPWFWPEIWHVNPSIRNPHLIYPGDVLYFSYVDGKPRVSLEAASAMRLSPEVRTSPLNGAIRAIPYDLLMDFVGRPSLLSKEDVKEKPYVVGMRDRHIIGSSTNEVYVRELGEPAAGTRYNIVAVGEKLHDPDDGDLLGYIGHYAGMGEVIQTSGAVVPGEDSVFNMKRDVPITHMRVVDVGREIMQGDKVFAAQAEIGADFVPSAPANEAILGQIIAVVDGVHAAGKYQVVAINRGKKHGLVPGNALGVFYRGELVRDRFDRQNWSAFTANYDKVQLPDERSATIMLFTVHDRMSYGLVVQSSQVINNGDFIAHPQYGHKEGGSTNFTR
jgi:LysM domain